MSTFRDTLGEASKSGLGRLGGGGPISTVIKCAHGHRAEAGEQLLAAAEAEVQASRKLIADLRVLHRPDSQNDPWCDEDGFCYPCRTIRMIDEAGL